MTRDLILGDDALLCIAYVLPICGLQGTVVLGGGGTCIGERDHSVAGSGFHAGSVWGGEKSTTSVSPRDKALLLVPFSDSSVS